MKLVLNAGAGGTPLNHLPYSAELFEDGWEEIRLDVNPKVFPHILCDIRDINAQDDYFDAVFSSHTLEHIHPSHLHYVISEFYRVLKPGGFVALYLPDGKKWAQKVLEDKVEEILYESDIGPIRTVDIIFGMEGAIQHAPEMMHRTVITDNTIKEKLEKAGFKDIAIVYDLWDIWVKAWK